ncbi:MAG: hypothetical protein ACKVZJ_01655 [Phycisphaerales bacterium]
MAKKRSAKKTSKKSVKKKPSARRAPSRKALPTRAALMTESAFTLESVDGSEKFAPDQPPAARNEEERREQLMNALALWPANQFNIRVLTRIDTATAHGWQRD